MTLSRFNLIFTLVCWLLPLTIANANVAADDACRLDAERQMSTIDPSVGNRVRNTTSSVLQPIRTPTDAIRNAKDVYLIYSFAGDICFQSHRRVKQGDILHVAVYGQQFELDSLKRFVLQCETESSDLKLIDTLDKGVFSGLSNDGQESSSGGAGIYWFSAQECFGEVVRFELRDSTNTLKFGKTVSQYPRFTGSFQLGALWTSLADRRFTRVTQNGSTTIQESGDSGTGPLYVGSLVIYGFPHYLATIGKDSHYSGRDIINENSWMDSVGLVVSIGLEDPTDTFGLGLSFEVARGFALSATWLTRRTNRLAGLSVGDEFAVDAGDIPVRGEWEDDIVFGISIDGRYLSRFFSG